MFSKKKTIKYTDDYWDKLNQLKEWIKSADAVIIGAGAGLSSAAGLEYNGKRFYDNFSDFANKYGLQDMYTAGFYPFATLEEYWAYWSRHIYLNRYQQINSDVYDNLLTIIKNKNYFVLTTNVDHCFQKAGFDKNRLFYTQGDYGLFQCSKACHQKTYDNKAQIEKMIAMQNDMKIPSNLIPYCPICGSFMCVNLRIDANFVQDEGWEHAAQKYNHFLNEHENKEILFIELGVGNNTPSIIKYPFWEMTYKNKKAKYVCINNQDIFYPPKIENQTIAIKADISKCLNDLIES